MRDASQPSAPPPPPHPHPRSCSASLAHAHTHARPNRSAPELGPTTEQRGEGRLQRRRPKQTRRGPGRVTSGHLGLRRARPPPPRCARTARRGPTKARASRSPSTRAPACWRRQSLRAGRHGTVQSPQSSVERSACPLGVLECSVDNKSPCSAPRLALPRRQSSPRPHLGHISATSRPYLGYISAISRPNAHHHRERAIL